MTGMSELEYVHMVADSPTDTIGQWFNAGGMIEYYDYPLETYMNVSDWRSKANEEHTKATYSPHSHSSKVALLHLRRYKQRYAPS